MPKREGRDNLFSHLFRSVYAAISTLWYAPPNVDANEYKAAIQGHYAILEATDGTLRRSLAASRHYNDYKIGDLNGNIDGRQGIKLGYGGVEVIETFNPERRDAIREEGGDSDINAPVNGQLQEEDAVMASTHGISHQAIDAASRALEAGVSQEQPEDLKEAKGATVTQRRGTGRVKPVPVDLELLKAVAERFDIQVRGGKGQGYDHALLQILSKLEQGTIEVGDSGQPVSQTVADQAKTLAWLTNRVEGLEAELVGVRREKEEATRGEEAQGMASLKPEVERLQAENQQLNAKLQLTRSRLEGIQGFLNGEAAPVDQGKGTAIQREGIAKPDAPRTAPPTALPSSQKPVDVPSQVDLDPDALRALQALLNYNDQTATAHPEKWAVSIPVMKDLLKQVGKATQSKIEPVLKAKSETIEQHHRLHGLGERHNRVHKGRSISEIIKL